MASTTVTRHLAAPRPEVYRALLDREAVRRWKVPPGMTSEIHEWTERPGDFRLSNPDIIDIPFDNIKKIVEPLKDHLPFVSYKSTEEDAQLRAIFDRTAILSSVALPIFLKDGTFWGFVGFDELKEERENRGYREGEKGRMEEKKRNNIPLKEANSPKGSVTPRHDADSQCSSSHINPISNTFCLPQSYSLPRLRSLENRRIGLCIDLSPTDERKFSF